MKALILDCFGVLYVDAGKQFYQTAIADYDSLRPRLHELSRQADLGYISQDELIDQVSELSGLDRSVVAASILGEHVRNEPLLQKAADLRQVGIKIGLLSNIGPGAIETFFDKTERSKLFDVSILSGEVGMIKPYTEMYLLTASKLGVEPSECLFVDDSLANCHGADAAGMTWHHYEDLNQAIAKIDSTFRI